MSKQDNLTDFLVDVADAIREKKGSSEKINPQNFSNEIKNLPSGEEVNTFGEVMVDKTGKGIAAIRSVIIEDGINLVVAYSYQYCGYITSIVLPESVTTIGHGAFYSCTALCNIQLPKSLEQLGQTAFYNCKAITHIAIPKGVTTIYTNTFTNCTGLKACDFTAATTTPTLANVNAFSNTTCQFIVPDNLYDEWIAATNWSTYADRIVKASEYFYIDFADPVVEKLCADNFGDGVGVTQSQANAVTTFPVIFQNNTEITSFDEFEMFENVSDLSYQAFRDCTSLSSITFPNLKNLQGRVFLGCSSLDIDINLPSLMTISGDRHFNNSAIRKVTSLGSITSISAAMFEGCTNLIEVIIPSTCSTIGGSAFFGCTALQSIVCNATTPPVLNSVIPNQSIVYVPDESVESYKAHTNWAKYADRIKPLSEYQPNNE